MKNPVFIQPLLNAAPQPPPQSRSANSPSIHDNPNPLKPIPVLIEELFDICSPALHKVAMIKPDTPHDTELFIQRNAKTWGANIHFLRSHYTAFKNTISPQELLKQEELEGLYSRIFKVLAESIFHVCRSLSASPTHICESQIERWTTNPSHQQIKSPTPSETQQTPPPPPHLQTGPVTKSNKTTASMVNSPKP